MKKRILLPILFLLTSVLAGCGNTNNPVGSESSPSNSETESTPESESSVSYTWSISNKEALTAPWRVKEDNRAVELACDPAINVAEHLDVDLFITSSDPTVVGVSGKYLSALSVGTATITVEFDGQTDSVTITVDEEAGEPEVITGYTLAQVFADNQHDDRGVLYEVEGLVINGYQSGKTDFSKYGNFVVNDGTLDADVLVYGATAQEDCFAWQGTAYKFTNPQDFQTNDGTKDIQLGYTLKMRVARFYYNGTTPELEGIVLDYSAPAKVPCESITLDRTTAFVRTGNTLKLNYTQAPAGADDAVTWTSSDTTVATVEGGTVTAVKAGTVTITAKVSDTISATCNITVEDPELEPTVIKTPVVGTQYKFGIKHDGLYTKSGNDWYYVTGEMDGYYAATVTNFTAAADVEVVEATGGYYLKATVGTATKYIDITTDGEHFNIGFGETAATVYTINENGHFVTNVGGEDYTIGTSASSTYNTLSPRKVSASSYVATLLDVSALTPVEPEKPADKIELAPTKSNNTGFTATETSWTENGITLKIEKGTSTSWDGSEGYIVSSDHARAYSGTKVTISYTGEFESIVLTTTGGKNVPSSTTVEGGTVTVNGTQATITVSGGVTSITFNASAQIRIAKITVNL